MKILVNAYLRLSFFISLFIPNFSIAQFSSNIKWGKDGNSYYSITNGEIVQTQLPDNKKSIIISREKLKPTGSQNKLYIEDFFLSTDNKIFLIYTNSKKVWRYNTRGDYWIYRLKDSSLFQLGKMFTSSSLMFAKISPDGNKVAYVYNYNLYVENLSANQFTQLTNDGNRKLIDGTFDYLYEQEFDCRDGFRWSPDSKQIAFWQIDARKLKDYSMENTTDSVYPKLIPVSYAVPGEKPSISKIGVIDINTSIIKWMQIPADTVLGSYIPRMEWAYNNDELIIQQLNRKQNESKLMMCNIHTGYTNTIYTESDSAWIDVQSSWDADYKMGGWNWLKNGNAFLWASEKDGWRHLYKISRDGKKENLITNGKYDVIKISGIDEKSGNVYFLASPFNATQSYLYCTKLSGKGPMQLLSPQNQQGTNSYEISPGCQYALHTFSNYYTPYSSSYISLSNPRVLNQTNTFHSKTQLNDKLNSGVSFFKIKTTDSTEMDGWMVKPTNFDSTKKYPVVFYVYGGPAAQTVIDSYGSMTNYLYNGSMSKDGYIYISIDNRGTPVPKGRQWRKCIYEKLGQLDVTDQAAAAEQIRYWPFVDSNRIAVWGWSNGGTLALNLIFRYPQIYKTAIAISPITNFLIYDNIYTERVLGLPQENQTGYDNGSPFNYAKNLKGNLLLMHGTGDDNVHYSNSEILINELIKYNKLFMFMPYPNRSHNINEGSGTRRYLINLYTSYLKEHCQGNP